MMGSVALQLNYSPYNTLSSIFLNSNTNNCYTKLKHHTTSRISNRNNNSRLYKRCFNNNNKWKIRAVGTTVPERDNNQANDEAIQSQEEEDEELNEPPYVGFAFVSSVLLPDGTPDLQMRSATGGQKLRDIMLDNHIDLYGPYGRPLLNCAGGGTCGSCMVEVIEGKELLNTRTDKEKEILKKKPKNWRLACQTTVGTPDSRGMVVVQQLPEWKAHEWSYEKDVPTNLSE